MNAAVQQQHILQAVNWSRFNLEEWLYQFGAWMNSVSGTCGRSVNPIAVAMDQAVVKRKQKQLTEVEKNQVIANYFTSEDKPKRNRSSMVCQIDDNEARAVQKLILDVQGQSEILDDWMDAVISRYFYGNSWSQMVTENRSQNDARSDVKCGLAALHSRYGFISF